MASDKLCCPFCAAEGRETSETDSDYPSKRFMFIQCSRCGARTASIYGSGDPSEWADARSNWNTRITSPTATDAQGVGEAPKAVAWMDDEGRVFSAAQMENAIHHQGGPGKIVSAKYSIPLYTHPTASTTAGLTEAAMLTHSELSALARQAQIDFCLDKAPSFDLAFAAAIQRACAEKWNVRLDGGAAK